MHIQTNIAKCLTTEPKQVFGVFELNEKGNILQCVIFLSVVLQSNSILWKDFVPENTSCHSNT